MSSLDCRRTQTGTLGATRPTHRQWGLSPTLTHHSRVDRHREGGMWPSLCRVAYSFVTPPCVSHTRPSDSIHQLPLPQQCCAQPGTAHYQLAERIEKSPGLGLTSQRLMYLVKSHEVSPRHKTGRRWRGEEEKEGESVELWCTGPWPCSFHSVV